MAYLILNAGSSSLKVSVYSLELEKKAALTAEEIGGEAARIISAGEVISTANIASHEQALRQVLEILGGWGFGLEKMAGAGHRVVHGGAELTKSSRITSQIEAKIDAYSALAPLHNPHNLAGIRALAARAPSLPQIACFDTAFHSTCPEVHIRYALPQEHFERGIRRYGFHGISYNGLKTALAEIYDGALPKRVLACHLGNGASLCALYDGQSIATTMGYSPLEGITMGTRAGNIDATAVLRLAEEMGIDETRALLNGKSGLLGLSGLSSDMRLVASSETEEAQLALGHFCYWARYHMSALIGAMQGVDVIAFTGEIGENSDQIRACLCDGFAWAGAKIDHERNAQNNAKLHCEGAKIHIWRIPADEERTIAAETHRIIRNSQ